MKSLLGGIEENFSEGAVLEPADAGCVPDATVFEIKQLVGAPVREAPTGGHP